MFFFLIYKIDKLIFFKLEVDVDADVAFFNIILIDTLASTMPTEHSICNVGYFY